MRTPSPAPPLTPMTADEVVALLERKLDEARAGLLTSIAIVGGYENGQLSVDTQGNAGQLLLGAVEQVDVLRRQIFAIPAGATRLSS